MDKSSAKSAKKNQRSSGGVRTYVATSSLDAGARYQFRLRTCSRNPTYPHCCSLVLSESIGSGHLRTGGDGESRGRTWSEVGVGWSMNCRNFLRFVQNVLQWLHQVFFQSCYRDCFRICLESEISEIFPTNLPYFFRNFFMNSPRVFTKNSSEILLGISPQILPGVLSGIPQQYLKIFQRTLYLQFFKIIFIKLC